MKVIAHGGAGAAPAAPTRRQAVLERAVVSGSDAATPVAAAITAVTRLEAAPQFNAGVGSAVEADGRIRVDAGVMTDDRTIGAVAAVPGVVHASRLADAVRTETPHVLLSGRQACRLADHVGIRTEQDLWTDHTRDRWATEGTADDTFGGQLAHTDRSYDRTGGTVGAVATNGTRVVAVTSTGGRWHALAGRVGDVPQAGCGFIAGSAGGVSATGVGEDIARTMLSRAVLDRIRDGQHPSAAVDDGMSWFAERVDGAAGVIVLTPSGTSGASTNAASMQTAVATDGRLHPSATGNRHRSDTT